MALIAINFALEKREISRIFSEIWLKSAGVP